MSSASLWIVCGGLEPKSDLSVDLMESSSRTSGVGGISFVGFVNDCDWESGTRSPDGEVPAGAGAVFRWGRCKSAGKAFSLLLLDGIVLGACNRDEGSADGNW